MGKKKWEKQAEIERQQAAAQAAADAAARDNKLAALTAERDALQDELTELEQAKREAEDRGGTAARMNELVTRSNAALANAKSRERALQIEINSVRNQIERRKQEQNRSYALQKEQLALQRLAMESARQSPGASLPLMSIPTMLPTLRANNVSPDADLGA